VTTRSNRAALAPGRAPSRGLTPECLDSLAAAALTLKVPAGCVVFRKGDPGSGCYLLLNGAVKVTLPAPAPGTAETLLAILSKGDIVGEMALLDRQPRSATVTAVRPCELSYISTVAFDRLASTDIEVHRQLLRVMTARLRASNETHTLQHLPLRTRLARVLLRLAQTFGEPLPGSRILVRQKISQVELGNMAGAARENVNRQLTEWRTGRLLSRIGGYYCLEDPPGFELLAGGD
jgi:CRP/FNR family transcriptional regulator, cyclic AMP receptor protein